MQNTCKKNRQLPYKCRWVCVSLIGGSLTMVFIFYISYLGYISTKTAIWVSMGFFILIAVYESFLIFSLTRHMSGEINKNTE
jgi:hypothetical protein